MNSGISPDKSSRCHRKAHQFPKLTVAGSSPVEDTNLVHTCRGISTHSQIVDLRVLLARFTYSGDEPWRANESHKLVSKDMVGSIPTSATIKCCSHKPNIWMYYVRGMRK